MISEGFWLFDGLEEEPYGLLPLVNLSAKGGPTSTKYIERLGSYQWNLEEVEPVIIVIRFLIKNFIIFFILI